MLPKMENGKLAFEESTHNANLLLWTLLFWVSWITQVVGKARRCRRHRIRIRSRPRVAFRSPSGTLDGSYAVPFCRRTIMPSFLRGPVRETRKDYVCPIQAS